MPGENQPDTDVTPIGNPKLYLGVKKLDLESKKIEQDHEVQLKQMEYENAAGFIGRVIGSPKHAPNNIAFAIVFLVALAGVIVAFFPGERVEFWKTIVPIITLTLGYLLGRNAAKE